MYKKYKILFTNLFMYVFIPVSCLIYLPNTFADDLSNTFNTLPTEVKAHTVELKPENKTYVTKNKIKPKRLKYKRRHFKHKKIIVKNITPEIKKNYTKNQTNINKPLIVNKTSSYNESKIPLSHNNKESGKTFRKQTAKAYGFTMLILILMFITLFFLRKKLRDKQFVISVDTDLKNKANNYFRIFSEKIPQNKIDLDETGDKFNILSTKSLGDGKYIHLVEVKGKQLVIGSTDNNISLLTEFKDKDIQADSNLELYKKYLKKNNH